MGASLRIGSVRGIDIRVHATFLFVLLLGAFQWKHLGVSGAIFGAALMLFVFACVVLHELGHSLVARAFGVPVKDITLYPIGGVAQLGKRPDTPLQELLVAIAGPAVNVVIVSLLLPLTAWSYGLDAMLQEAQTIGQHQPTMLTLSVFLLLSNVGLAVFNMIPAFPMDGGRVLRAVLAMLMPGLQATRIAVTIGRVLAVGMMALGVFVPGLFLLTLVGFFIFLMAGFELRESKLMQALAGIRAGDAVNPYVPRFTPATTVGEAMQALVFVPHQAFAVEHFGRLVGVVTRNALVQAANEDGPWSYVAGVMERQVPTVKPNDVLEQARLKMNEAGSPYVAVTDGELFLGLITEHELAQHVSMYEALQRPEARTVRQGNEGRP